MKIIKFLYKNKIYWGKLWNSEVRFFRNTPFRGITLTRQTADFRKIRLLPPAEASKIILVGLNYKDHARELKMKIPKEPVIFLKPTSSLIGHGQDIIYPHEVKQVDYEGELALVIKKSGRNIPKNRVWDYILGYTCLNDVTARGLQKKDSQWTRSKSFDTFCPLGPWLETSLDPRNLRIRSYVNSKLCQDSSTANFIFSVDYLVSFISKIMTLYAGDIVSTGTPYGVGELKPKDKIEVEIEGIGRLSNQVVR